MESLASAIVELILAVGAMALLMVGVFSGSSAFKTVSLLSIGVLVIAILGAATLPTSTVVTYGGLFVVDGFAAFNKILILLGSALALVMSIDYLRKENLARFEFAILVLLATLGMTMMVSANNLIALYLGIELQSLALYVLAAINRDSSKATEAGLKYFVLGALSSGMLLYGSSLIYGFSGSLEFSDIMAAAAASDDTSFGLLFGLVFLLAGLAFKISAAPFHMWTPDVYEGAPTPVTAFFAGAPKVAAMALLIRVLFDAIPGLMNDWQQIIIFLAMASMAVGTFFALVQTNIKRLMAFSSISHVGFALVGLSSADQAGVGSVLIYLSIYLVMNIGTFALILSMRRKEGMAEDISDLAGLGRTRPAMALCLAVFLFSLAGIPPLAGFFGKFFVLMQAINAGHITLAIFGVIMSVIGAFYYLRIFKIMYFDTPVAEFDVGPSRALNIVSSATAVLVVAYALWPTLLNNAAMAAAGTLF